MNQTINISLPAQLKAQASAYVEEGLYSSFSDLVRTAIRGLFTQSKYNVMVKQAQKDHLQGKSTMLTTHQDIDNFFDKI